MTRTEFDNMEFAEVMETLDEERDDVTTYERLKEFAVYNVENDNLLVAIHILEALQSDSDEWYLYDYCMETQDTPSSVTCKEDVEHLIDD